MHENASWVHPRDLHSFFACQVFAIFLASLNASLNAMLLKRRFARISLKCHCGTFFSKCFILLYLDIHGSHDTLHQHLEQEYVAYRLLGVVLDWPSRNTIGSVLLHESAMPEMFTYNFQGTSHLENWPEWRFKKCPLNS